MRSINSLLHFFGIGGPWFSIGDQSFRLAKLRKLEAKKQGDAVRHLAAATGQSEDKVRGQLKALSAKCAEFLEGRE
jgi:hypothetical protein